MKRPPKTRAAPAVQKSLTSLVQAAAGGRRDLAWLDKAIRRAGYLKSGDVLSREDARRAAASIAQTLVDAETTAETPCCKECLHHAIDAITALATGTQSPDRDK